MPRVLEAGAGVNEHRKNTVILSAWVDPALREYARVEAKASGVSFSEFVSRAVQRAVAEASAERATRDAIMRGLHPSNRRIR